jgi:DNA polymerase III alpha subunit
VDAMVANLRTILKVGCCGLLLTGSVQAGTVDVNVASVQALESIKGIGTTTAQRIVAERARGPYESLEHLSERLSGIGAKRIQKLKSAGLCAGTPKVSCALPLPSVDQSTAKRGRDNASGEGVTPAVIHLP